MERNFDEVLEQIMKVAPKDLYNALERSAGFWAPEIRWYMLSLYVNKYVAPNIADGRAIQIYAILCDCTISEMMARFEEDCF